MVSLTWKQLEVKGRQEDPFKRAGHSAVLVGSKIYVTGGYRHDTDLVCIKEMHILDISTSRVQAQQLPPTFMGYRFHTADVIGSTIWYVGGYTTGALDQREMMRGVVMYDTKREAWTELTVERYANFGTRDPRDPENGIFERYNHCSAVNPSCKHQIFIYGGAFKKQSLGDLILLDTKKKQVTLMIASDSTQLWPSPRQKASMVAVGHCLYLSGGTSAGAQPALPIDPADSLCVFDCLQQEWIYSGSGKGHKHVRMCHRSVAVGQQVVVVGGYSAKQKVSKVHSLMILDIVPASPESCPIDEELVWSQVDAPIDTGMDRMSPAVVAKGKTLYIIGGTSKDGKKTLYAESWVVSMRATTAGHPQQKAASLVKAPPKSAPLPQKKEAAAANARSPPAKKPQAKLPARKVSPEENESEIANPRWKPRKRQKADTGRVAPASLKALGNLSDSGSDVAESPPARQPARKRRLEPLPPEDPPEEDAWVAELEEKLAGKEVEVLDLRNELEDARDKAKRLEEDKEDLKLELRDLKERLRQEQKEKLKQIDALGKRQKELTAEKADLRREKDDLRGTIASLKTDRTTRDLELQSCREDLEKAQGEAERWEGEMERVRREKDAAVESFQASSRRSGEENADLKRQLQESRQKTEAALKNNQDLEEKLEKERQVSAAAKSKATQAELKLGQVEGEAAAAKEQAKARLAEERLRAEAAEKQHAQDRELIEKLKAQKEAVMQQKKAADGKREDLEKRLQERMQDLEGTQAQLQGLKDYAFRELKETKDAAAEREKALSSLI